MVGVVVCDARLISDCDFGAYLVADIIIAADLLFLYVNVRIKLIKFIYISRKNITKLEPIVW